jgi:hypothetical protein
VAASRISKAVVAFEAYDYIARVGRRQGKFAAKLDGFAGPRLSRAGAADHEKIS